MKRIPFYSVFVFGTIVFLLSLAFPASAQTIHVVIAADGQGGFGANLRADYRNVRNVFTQNVPKSQLRLVALDMEEVNPDSILEAVSKIKPAPSDTLVVYYSGHAANDSAAGGHYFQFRDASGKTSELQRRILLAAMKEKKPRLAVLLTDCCNIDSKSTGHSKEKDSDPTPESPESVSPLFESLFLRPEGVVDITSSKKGEASFVDSTSKRRGSCFTYPMVALLQKHKNDGAMTWEKFVALLKTDVQKAFEESWPNGYRFDPPMNGVYTQKTQTVEVYGTLPGTNPVVVVRQGPRFGVRAVDNGGTGVRITELFPNSPGFNAGFEVGDIILEINGRPINSEKIYSDAVDESPKRMNVKLINVNDKKILNVSFDLGY